MKDERGPDGSWSNVEGQVGPFTRSAFERHKALFAERAAERAAERTPDEKLNTLSENVYIDLHAVSEKVEDIEDDVKTALNSLMELSILSGRREDATEEWAKSVYDWQDELTQLLDQRFKAFQNGITLAVKERIARDAQLQEQIEVERRRRIALQASYDGLLARCNAVEARLIARIERVEKGTERPDPTRRTKPDWMKTDAP